MLTHEYDRENGILMAAMHGRSDREELRQFMEREYPKIESGLIWDLSKGDMSNLSMDDLWYLIDVVKAVARHRKTAYISKDDLQFGLLRVYSSYAESHNVAPLMMVFRSRPAAIQWLKGSTA